MGGKCQGNAQCNLLIKTWKESKVSKKLQLGMFTALTEIASKELLYWLLQKYVLCTLWKSTRQHCQIVWFWDSILFNPSKYVFNCLSIYVKWTERHSSKVMVLIRYSLLKLWKLKYDWKTLSQYQIFLYF